MRFVLASVVFIEVTRRKPNFVLIDDKPPEEVLDNMVSTFLDSKVIAKESGEEQQIAVEELGEKLEQQPPSPERQKHKNED